MPMGLLRVPVNACRRLFGDAALGAVNLEMIDTARAVGAAAKFTGSGGAIIVLCKDEDQENQLEGDDGH